MRRRSRFPAPAVPARVPETLRRRETPARPTENPPTPVRTDSPVRVRRVRSSSRATSTETGHVITTPQVTASLHDFAVSLVPLLGLTLAPELDHFCVIFRRSSFPGR